MIRATAFLVVAVFAGTPVVSLACEIGCSATSRVAHHAGQGCHDAGTDASGPQPVDGKVDGIPVCHEAVTIAPFLTETKLSATVRVTPSAALTIDRRAAVALDGETTHLWGRTSRGEAPDPPTLGAVLRL